MQTPPSDSQRSFQELHTLRVVWGALLLSIGMYVYVGMMKTGGNFVFDLTEANPQTPVEMVLTGMALFMIVLAFVIPNVILNNAKKTLSPQASRSDLAKRYFVPFIIRLALLESCTIYGLVMAIPRGNVMIMLPLACLSVIGYLLNFPSEVKIRASLQGPQRI